MNGITILDLPLLATKELTMKQQDSINTVPIGRKRYPAQLDAEADMELISRLIREASQYISGAGLQRVELQLSN